MTEVVTTTKEAALAARISEAMALSGVVGDGHAAQQYLGQLPYPTTRLERWKYTRVARLLDFEPQSLPETDPPGQILPGFNAHRLVFTAGKFTAGTVVDEGKDGLFIGPVSAALERYPERVGALAKSGFKSSEWFAAMQASAPQDGACILIPEGHRSDQPILIHHHMPAGARAAQPGHLIKVGHGATAEVVLWSDSPAGACGLMNGSLDASVGDAADLTLEIVQDEAGKGHHIGHHHFTQGKDSQLTVRTATARAHWLRNDLQITQGGTGANSTFHGCYLPNGEQFVDHHTRIDHAHPDGQSDELYKGLAADAATAVFNGKIMVHKDAQRIEAYQSNANLLLGERASVFTKPELEIYADDVRCSHGCTTGQFNREALFYLRSRGMTETAAHNLLVQAFLAEVLDGFRPMIRDHVHAVYAERLGWT